MHFLCTRSKQDEYIPTCPWFALPKQYMRAYIRLSSYGERVLRWICINDRPELLSSPRWEALVYVIITSNFSPTTDTDVDVAMQTRFMTSLCRSQITTTGA